MVKLVEYQSTNLKYLAKVTNCCNKCGNVKLRFNNLRGWTSKSVECSCCGQKITGSTIEEAINLWNKQNKKALL